MLNIAALLLEPEPLGNSAFRQTNLLWIDLAQNGCLSFFAADFVLYLASVVMLLGFGIIATPTASVTASGFHHHQ